jgi:hypothetical protein
MHMQVIGDRKFVEIPGDRRHELPPLLVHPARNLRRLDRVMDMAGDIIQSEDLLGPAIPDDEDVDRRRMDLAINLVEQYLGLIAHWQWGDSVLEWIRQCEITFLRPLLRTDIWPHAGRCSFVTLLHDKSVQPDGVTLEEAVGLRLTFRQPPPISYFSNQFLLLLNSRVAISTYDAWARLSPDPVASFPPERFTFDVVKM